MTCNIEEFFMDSAYYAIVNSNFNRQEETLYLELFYPKYLKED